MNATIFDIQRCSFVDGPGIRTTVFFKGCNLKCAWCHNPESQSSKPSAFYYSEKCIHCGKCASVCQSGAVKDGVIDFSKCVRCGRCELFCPTSAVKLCGREYSTDELFDIIEKDRSYYENSNGGVTFSGGECMLFCDSLTSILKKCHENGIHTAVDTAGNVPWENFEAVLPFTDLFLYDIKSANDEKHVSFTGVSNKPILENLKRLFEKNANIIIRIPVIPSFNDDIEDMRMIRDLLSRFSPLKVELLPYHNLGENKYRALGMDLKSFDIPEEEKLRRLRAVFDA